MEIGEAKPVAAKKPPPTPKAVIHQKYGSKACYRVEEVKDPVEGGCPGLVIAQQVRSMYRCSLDLPGLSVTSDTFARKKDAEQAAARIAIEKLGIHSTTSNPTPEEALNELVARISDFFTDEFLSSSHPLIGHFRVALGRDGELFGMVPMSAIAACDVKVNSLCKVIDTEAEIDPLLVLSLILKAAKMSDSVCTTDGEFWIWKKGPYSPQILQSITNCNSGIMECACLQAIYIPCSIEEHVETTTLDLSSKQYYLDEIAQKLNVRDSSQILASRTVGKASSEMKLYFSIPEVSLLSSDSSVDQLATVAGNINVASKLNLRASYISGQTINGDVLLANAGYTWKSSDLFYEDVSPCSYYRLLLAKLPDGHYKLSREAILVAELPSSCTSRSNWRGPSPRDLLSVFCRQHRLPEPHFSVKRLNSAEVFSELPESCKKMKIPKITDKVESQNAGASDCDMDRSRTFSCEVKVLSRSQDPLIECSISDTYRKESDAIHNAAFNILTWLNKYFVQLDMTMENLCSSGQYHNIKVYPHSFAKEFARCLSVHGVKNSYYPSKCSSLGSVRMDQPYCQESGVTLFNIEGLDSNTSPSSGSFVCISYAVALVGKQVSVKEPLENIDEFEFEIGTGSVIDQLESCVTQLSVNQAAQFITELPPRELILAAAGECSRRLLNLSFDNCFLEYSVKVLRVTEPPEDRMEQAFFSPPLSKQRVEFAVGHINKSHSATLVDFGCGSGSLLDSLLGHTTTLEKIVGVDISRKGLSRAAKILHSKLSTNPVKQSHMKSAVLFAGSITELDSRLKGFDIGTCLEVIEHMEEDQACLFGDVVLSFFCPRVLIVSTPNYEYNPILQKSSTTNKEDATEDKSEPCRFRNHDHKFEWTRQQFEHWATGLAVRHNYSVEFSGVGGSADVEPGFASQIAVFIAISQGEKDCSRSDESFHPYEVVWEWPDMYRSAMREFV